MPGVAHHVTQRGNNRRAVFRTSGDRWLYLELLGRQAQRNGTKILGYRLMTNHVHIVAVPERPDSLALTFGRAHSAYAQALNTAEDWSGHLWQNRFFSCPLDEFHLMSALRYVDLNPVRAGLVTEPWEWPWSSARAHIVPRAMDRVLDLRWEEHLGRWNFAEWRLALRIGLPDGECGEVRKATQTGAPLGSQEFVEGLERQAGRRLRVFARGRPQKKTAAATAGVGPQGCPSED